MLEVGSVFARAGLRVDDDGFAKFERKMDGARRDAKRDVKAEGKLDVDKRGFDTFDRKVNDSERHAGRGARTFGRLSKAGAGVGLAMGGALAAGAAAGGLAIGKAVSEFEDAAKVGAQTEAVIKSTGGAANVTADQVSRLAESISNKTAIDDEAIQTGANMLLTFTNIRNEAGRGNDIFNQSTQILTDMSVALGTDASKSAIQLGKALNDPIKGVTALSRVGVTFDEQTKQHITTLVEQGKTMDAQKIILRELNKEFGGSAEAQARPLARAKVAVDNLFEAIGRGLSPAVTAVSNGLADFVEQIESGTGAGGRFRQIVLNVVGAIRSGVNTVADFARNVRAAFAGDSTGQVSGFAKTVATTLRSLVSFVKGVIADVRAAFRGLGPDLRAIANLLRGVFVVAWTYAFAVIRRVLPGVRAALSGILTVVRGFVRVIGGLLRGDFGEAWEGVKDIVRGALRAVGGIIRATTAPIRQALSTIAHLVTDVAGGAFRGLRSVVSGVVSSVIGAFGRFRNVIARVMAFVVDRIGDMFDLAGHLPFVGDKFDGLGDKAHALADRLRDVGAAGDRARGGLDRAAAGGNLLSNAADAALRLAQNLERAGNAPAPKAGRKRFGGKVGPNSGGPRLFIAGEGHADEWVISQEGNRGENVRWAREALETLTGRKVALHRKGKSPAAGERGVARLERAIDTKERDYTRADRAYSRTSEEYLTENAAGDPVVDKVAVKHRADELDDLINRRSDLKAMTEKLRKRYIALQKILAATIKRLTRALNGIHGKSDGAQRRRDALRNQIAGYKGRLGEIKDMPYELSQAALDMGVDLDDLRYERREVTGTKAPPPAAPADTGGGSTDVPDDPESRPPTADEIARAAAEQVRALQAARDDLFGSFGSNFQTAGGPGLGRLPGEAIARELVQAAGLRRFGVLGSGGDPGDVGPRALHVNIDGQIDRDPYSWAYQAAIAAQAAMG